MNDLHKTRKIDSNMWIECYTWNYGGYLNIDGEISNKYFPFILYKINYWCFQLILIEYSGYVYFHWFHEPIKCKIFERHITCGMLTEKFDVKHNNFIY